MKLGKEYEYLLLVLYPKTMISFQKTSIWPVGAAKANLATPVQCLFWQLLWSPLFPCSSID